MFSTVAIVHAQRGSWVLCLMTAGPEYISHMHYTPNLPLAILTLVETQHNLQVSVMHKRHPQILQKSAESGRGVVDVNIE